MLKKNTFIRRLFHALVAGIALTLAAGGDVLAQASSKKKVTKESSVTLTKKECQSVVAHTPSADVAYKPGVDVYGRKVAPADVPGSPAIKIPDEITIDIGFNLKDKYGLAPTGAYKGETVIGKVTVKNGRVYWDGKPIDNNDQQAVAEECRKIYGAKK